jgi:hypothetical protein
MIFSSSNCDFREIKVVIVPAPAMMGKAKGTMECVFVSISSLLKILLPNVISIPIKKMISAPAIANELVSTPNKCKMNFPAKKNPIMMIPEARVACPG